MPAVVAVLMAATAGAQSPTPIQVEDGSGCLRAEELWEEVRSILARDLESQPLPFEIEVSVTGHSVDVRFVREGETFAARLLDTAGLSCRERFGGTAVVIAVLFDERATQVRLSLPPVPEPVPEPVVAPEPAEEPPEPSAVAVPAPIFEWRFAASAGGTVSGGWMPRVAGAVLVELAIGRRRWTLGLGGELWPFVLSEGTPRVRTLAALGTLSFSVRLLDRERGHLAARSALAVGVVHGVGEGATETFGREEPVLRLDLDLEGALRVAGPLFLFARLGAGATLRRPVFVADLAGERRVLHAPDWLTPRGALGLRMETRW